MVSFCCTEILAQDANTKSYTITTGEGWYRIGQGTHYSSAEVNIKSSNNNKVTNITFHVALMAYGQGGNISIINNFITKIILLKLEGISKWKICFRCLFAEFGWKYNPDVKI